MTRRDLLFTIPAAYGAQICDTIAQTDWNVPLPTGITPCPLKDRLIGIAYSTWFSTTNWESPLHAWGTPLLGTYRSDDPVIITQHAKWLHDAGIDFIFVDWSNEFDADLQRLTGPANELSVEKATLKLFETYSSLEKRPKISIFIGHEKQAFFDGRAQSKADEIYNFFVRDNRYGSLIQYLHGKPLLVVYVNTPSPFQDGLPPFDDKRFTVRFMTGYVSNQPSLLNGDGVSRYGYWSWEDRGPPTYSIFNGHPEAMTIVAAWRASSREPASGRQNGRIFMAEWKRLRRVGPQVALITTFNEWWRGEQHNAEESRDVEPSREFGYRYLDIIGEQGQKFRSGL